MKWWSFMLLIVELSIPIFARHLGHGNHHYQLDNWNEPHFRIVNGTPATENQFPWAAALLSTPCNKLTGMLDYSKGEDYREKCCGASIITSKFLITAAHCFFVAAPLDHNRCKDYCDCDPVYQYDPKDLKVVVGALSIDFLNNMGKWHNIETFYIHPEFNKKSLANDIGLIALPEDNLIQFTLHPHIAPIELWPNLIGEGTKATICGWGDNCWEQDEDPDKRREDESQFYHLKYINVITSDFDTCSWDKMTYNKTYENIICAVAENKNLGLGDSGNGLFALCGNTNRLIGVASTFHKCGHTQPGNVSSAYTRLSTFEEWINEIINNNREDYMPDEYGINEPDGDNDGDEGDDGDGDHTDADFEPEDFDTENPDAGDPDTGDHDTGDYYTGNYGPEDYNPLGDNYWDYTSYHPYYAWPYYYGPHKHIGSHKHWSYWSSNKDPLKSESYKDPFNNDNYNSPCNIKSYNNGSNDNGNIGNGGNGNNGNNNNGPCKNGPYNSAQSMNLWQWIHMYPGISTERFPENYNDDDNDSTIKHKSNFNYVSNVNSNSNHNNNNNINSNTNFNHNSNFGFNKYGLHHNVFLRKHSKPKANNDDDNDDNNIKHKMNFNYNSNINTNTNNNNNHNLNVNDNHNRNVGYNSYSHNLYMRNNDEAFEKLDDDDDKK